MADFVLLEHDHPDLHWDLMLEMGEVLWTWRLQSLPKTSHSGPAQRIFDHRLVYLDYEGPVSGGRGHVLRVDRGEYLLLHLQTSLLEVLLQGQFLKGRLTLRQLQGESWWLTLEEDRDLQSPPC